MKLTESSIRDLVPTEKEYDAHDDEFPNLVVRVFPTGKKVWCLRYRSGGKSKRLRIGDTEAITPAAARRSVKGITGRIAQGEDPNQIKVEQKHARKRSKDGTLRAFLAASYAPWVTVERRTGTELVKRIQSSFAAFLDTPMDAITAWDMERWRKAKHEAGRSPSTTNRDLNALKACLAKAVDWGAIDKHPLSGLKPRRTDKEAPIRVISDDEEAALWRALRARDARMRTSRLRANQWRAERDYELFPAHGAFADHLEPVVLLALATGMRRGEILSLRTEDLKSGTVTVRGASSKSQQSRAIPLNADAQRVLTEWGAKGEWVFPGDDSETALTTIKKSWAGLRKAAGLPSVRFHDLRHTFATRLLQRGADIRTVSSLLGHHDIGTTARYLHATDESKRRAVDLLTGA